MKEPQKSVTTVQTIIIHEEYLRLMLCHHFDMPDDSTLIIEEGEIILSHASVTRDD